jgi:ATP-dependent Clp protease ATP-binding subunit ClpC
MFERYTEKARRVIFFARYEASQFGSPYIETEHLLLGLLREDKALTNRFLRSHASVESIRKQIEGHTTIREKVSTSVDLPLSNECKRVLAYAAEEAERLSHKHIGTEHLLLGLLREEKCFAAEILHERGLKLLAIREELARATQEKAPPSQRNRESSLLAEFSRDLTQAAMDSQLDPLVGRDQELERVVQILCRRTKNNPVLIGEPGVGKTAIVEGLAQRISDRDVPSFLADKRVLALDLSLIVAGTKYRGQFEERLKTIMKELMENQNSIIFIDELHTLMVQVRPRDRWMRPIFSSRRCRAARFSASAQPRRPNIASRSKRTGRSNGASRPSRCRLRTKKTRSASLWVSRTVTRNSTRSATPMIRSFLRYRIRAAIFPTASCRTRPST